MRNYGDKETKLVAIGNEMKFDNIDLGLWNWGLISFNIQDEEC